MPMLAPMRPAPADQGSPDFMRWMMLFMFLGWSENLIGEFDKNSHSLLGSSAHRPAYISFAGAHPPMGYHA